MKRSIAVRQVEYLVADKFPVLRRLMLQAHRTGKSDELRAMEKQATVYRAELRELPEEAINKLYKDLRGSERQDARLPNLCTPHRSKLESTSAAIDYAFWAKMTRWSVAEAVALSLGLPADNGLVASDLIYETDHLNRLAFVRLKALVIRAMETGAIVRAGKGIAPESYIAWAHDNDISFPTELGNLVHQRAARNRDRESALKPVALRERDTFLKMIGGMAVGGYGYDPKAMRSSTIKEIHDDLARQGIALDLDTIRNKLKEATRLMTDAL